MKPPTTSSYEQLQIAKKELRDRLFYACQSDYDENCAMNNYPTPDEEADEAIEKFIKYIIDDLTIEMSKTYKLDKPPFWLIEWIKKYKKEDYEKISDNLCRSALAV